MRNPTSKSLRRIVHWANAGCLVYCSLISLGCADGKPVVLESSRHLSPDSHWVTILENVDNGLGFGMGAEYNEVHIQRPDAAATIHGDPDPSVVFYIEAGDAKEDRPRVHWTDSSHLLIEYLDLYKPGKAITQLNGIMIEYRTFRRPTAGSSIHESKR